MRGRIVLRDDEIGGHTDDLAARVWQHKTKAFGGFTAKYGVDKLVWYEVHETRATAFVRERQVIIKLPNADSMRARRTDRESGGTSAG